MFLINQNGRDLAPMKRTEVETMIADGSLQGSDWVWDEKVETWAPISELFPEHFPSFVAGLPEDLNEFEAPTGALPPPDPLAAERFMRQGQRRKLVETMIETISQVQEPGESILSIATQRKPIPDIAPETLGLTSRRIFILEKGHFKTLYDEFLLGDVLHPVLRTGLFFGHIAFNAGTGEAYGVKFIPKKQAIPFFTKMKAEISRVHEEHRATLCGTPPQVLSPGKKTANSPEPIPNTPTQSMSTEDEAAKRQLRLEQLQELLTEGLITPEDFERKKTALLGE